MKNLIVIGAYCPDDERIDMLENLIDSLEEIKKSYDILISTHSILPNYIVKKVDYVFYDRNNEIIYDLNYINPPWFSPNPGRHIYSTYVSGYSTYIASYRLLIGGLGMGKVMGYTKTHWIEYDTIFTDLSEIDLNDNLLDEYGSILYRKESKDYENNLEWGIGNIMSFNLKKIDNELLKYNRKKLLSYIEGKLSKTNERVTEEILSRTPILIKDFKSLNEKNIKVNLSNQSKKDELDYWAIPFYDKKTNKLKVITWNNKNEKPINVIFIINDEKIILHNNVNKFEWKEDEVTDMKRVNTIVTVIDGKIKNNIQINQDNIEVFKKTNYVTYD